MMESANFVLEFGFYLLLGWFVLRVVGMITDRHLEHTLTRLDADIAATRKIYKRVKIEEYNETFYLFNADTDEFIGQGRTMQEIAERVRDEVVLNVMEGDPDVIQRFKNTFPQTDLA